MATTIVSGVQYSGIWSLSGQANAKALTTWPSPPSPALYSWGQNAQGQLGLGNSGAGTYKSSPNQVGSLTNWATLPTPSMGYLFSAAIKTDGTLWTWGWNDAGRLGLGNTTSYSSPKQVGSLTAWSKLTLVYQSVISIKTDGTLWSWGRNLYGQLGLGNTTYYSSPKQVGALTTWSNIAGCRYHTVATKTDGTLWTWGAGGLGRLGLGNVTNYSSPKQVGALTTWSIVASGMSNSTAAIKTDGTLWTWGQGPVGQLGLGNETSYSSPKQVGALTTWLKVSGGLYRNIATKS